VPRLLIEEEQEDQYLIGVLLLEWLVELIGCLEESGLKEGAGNGLGRLKEEYVQLMVNTKLIILLRGKIRE
jgi:hypothetical protein